MRTPADARVLDDAATTYLLTSGAASPDFVAEIDDTGTEVVTAGENRVDLAAGLDALEDRGIDRLMVEGGGELIFSLFRADLVDELSTFVGLRLDGIERLDDGALLSWTVE